IGQNPDQPGRRRRHLRRSRGCPRRTRRPHEPRQSTDDRQPAPRHGLQAALIEFAAHGLDGTSAKDIAQRAGISQPYLFRLVPTKKALFLILVRRCFQQMAELFAAAAVGQAGEEALQAMGCAFGQLCNEQTLPLMQLHAYAAAATDPEIQAATRAAFQQLRNSVEQLTGPPPPRAQSWFGIGMLTTASTP